MLNLTKQERAVVLALSLIFAAGLIIDGMFHRFPGLYRKVCFMDAEIRPAKIDINKAASKDLEQIPYLGATLTRRILEERNRRGGFTDLRQLRNIPGIGEGKFKTIAAYVTITKEK